MDAGFLLNRGAGLRTWSCCRGPASFVRFPIGCFFQHAGVDRHDLLLETVGHFGKTLGDVFLLAGICRQVVKPKSCDASRAGLDQRNPSFLEGVQHNEPASQSVPRRRFDFAVVRFVPKLGLRQFAIVFLLKDDSHLIHDFFNSRLVLGVLHFAGADQRVFTITNHGNRLAGWRMPGQWLVTFEVCTITGQQRGKVRSVEMHAVWFIDLHQAT